MLLPQSRIKRALAIGLSCCFGWTFFACLWLCSHHSDQASEDSRNYQKTRVVIPGDCEHCPIEAAKGVIPVKQSTIGPLTAAVAHAFSTPPQHAGAGNSAARIYLPLSNADPPVERLCVYRI
jgi:hypothetical protein